MPSVDLTPYYQPQGSTSDGTKFDNLLALLQSTLNGLDNNNFASGKIFDPSKLMQNSANDGDPLVWDGTNLQWVRASSATRLRQSGYSFSHDEFTGNVSVTATTEATANTVVTSAATTYDGSTPVVVEFFAPVVRPDSGAAGRNLALWLYQDSASIGQLTTITIPAAAVMDTPVRLARKITPSSGSHTYSVRASVNAGTGTVFAGAGGLATTMPGFIRIVRA